MHRQIFESDEAVAYAYTGEAPNAADNRWLHEAYGNEYIGAGCSMIQADNKQSFERFGMYYRASWSLLTIACLLLGCAGERNSVGYSEAATAEEQSAPVKVAPFVPSPIVVVERMLEFAEVTEKDVVYDLGAGDGRVVITAAKK